MAKFKIKYDVNDEVTRDGVPGYVIRSIRIDSNGVIYYAVRKDEMISGWVNEERLKPATKEMFVAVFDNGAFGVPLSSIKKIDDYYASAISSPYKIMKLVDIEE
jgi:hypothetical protein